MLCSAARSARALCPLPACCPREAIPAQSSGGGTGWGAQRCGVLPGGVALPSLTDSCFGSAPAQDSPLLLNAQCHAWLLGNPPPHTHSHTDPTLSASALEATPPGGRGLRSPRRVRK